MRIASSSDTARGKRRQAGATRWWGSRRLAFEPLEARRLLAVLTVNSLEDNAVADDGFVTLREAIHAANTNTATDLQQTGSGADEILFAPALDGDTIFLTGGELQITEALSIDATSLAAGLTIDAQRQSRIFHIAAKTGDFTIAGLSLTAGRTTDPQPPVQVAFGQDGDLLGGEGGAIRSLTDGTLTIIDSTISGSRTEGDFAAGGGIYARGDVLLTRSDVTGNHTQGENAEGGGIYTLGDLLLTESTVSGNFTQGANARGGGLFALGNVSLDRSHVRVNHTIGAFAAGAGIAAGDVEGGLGIVSIFNSTVSGNFTVGSAAHGAGIAGWGPVFILHSDVIYNIAFNPAPVGGGIWTHDDTISIANSIVALNSATGGSPDLRPGSALNAAFSLIGNNSGTQLAGAPVGAPDAAGNLIGTAAAPIDPLLGSHADNGGPTITHALLDGSPAINAGDPGAAAGMAGVPQFDQRGVGFTRVARGRLDMGAFELQESSNDTDPDNGSEDPDGGDNQTNNGAGIAFLGTGSSITERTLPLALSILPGATVAAPPPLPFAAERMSFPESDGGSGGGMPLDEDNFGPRAESDTERALRDLLSRARIATREDVIDAAYSLGDIERVSLVGFDMGDEPIAAQKKQQPARGTAERNDPIVVKKPTPDLPVADESPWDLAIWSALAGGGTLWMGGAWWWLGRTRRRSAHQLMEI